MHEEHIAIDARHRFRCHQCGGVTRGIYTRQQSDISREIVYRCTECNSLIKAIETIIERASFKPIN